MCSTTCRRVATHVQNLDNEEPGTIDFTQAIPDDSYFKPSALRRRGTPLIRSARRRRPLPSGEEGGADPRYRRLTRLTKDNVASIVSVAKTLAI
ncbi:Uncharacterised protein [Pseudomonas aeruginosa]|nr:Uncharacterised protein [Pseudomonas aeruginosa]